MIRSYNSTLFINAEDLPKADVQLIVYENVKYEKQETEPKRVSYTGLTSWDIIEGGEAAKAIESITDKSGIDDYHSYLILHFNNGETATFRNSYVSLFID